MATHTISQNFSPVAAVAAVTTNRAAINHQAAWAAIRNRDRRADGTFFYAVRTTGVFCRPSCASRPPLRKNVALFPDAEAAQRAGFRPCLRCRPTAPKSHGPAELVRRACALLDRLQGDAASSELTRLLGVSLNQLERAFRELLGVSVHDYLAASRFERFRKALAAGLPVADAIYQAGYSSSRGAYENVSARLGMTPARFRARGRGVEIRYACAPSPAGRLLVAVTAQGLCRIALASTDAELRRDLAAHFPAAELVAAQQQLLPLAHTIAKALAAGANVPELPLDVQLTAFQRRVYRELKKIPPGQTRSYAEIARSLGSPRGHRAVARACAANEVALAIPCHRVVRSDGVLGGYRWGMERKKRLLQLEKASLSR